MNPVLSRQEAAASPALARPALRLLLGGLYLALVTALLYWSYAGWGYDDPFITYRYARNLAEGLGPVYNPGERVLSTTTPLFALLLAVPAALGADLPRLAVLVGAASLAAGGLCLWALGRAWRAPAAGWAGLLLYPCVSLLGTTLGSETPLYLALGLGAFAAYAHGRLPLAAACSALMTLARPDGALVPVLLAAHYLGGTALKLRRAGTDRGWGAVIAGLWKAVPWRALGVFLALSLPWVLFAWAYYGTPVPVTLSAKRHQGAMEISQTFFEGFLPLVSGYLKRWDYRLEALLALLGLGFALFKERRWLLLLAWTVVYFAAYSLLDVSRYFWYYAPLVPGFIAAAGLGVQTLAAGLARLGRSPARAGRLQAGAALLLVLPLAYSTGRGIWSATHPPDPRLPVYRELGEWLRANTAPDALVGTIEVGILGYYAERPMVDFAGLIRPQVAEQLTPRTTYEDAAIWAVEQYRPEYIMLPEGAFSRLWEREAAGRCAPLTSASGEKYGSEIGPHVIYECRW